MLHFIIGKAGFGKTREIYKILENAENPEQTLLLVPEQASFEAERKMLDLPPEKRCEVLSFTRLCHRVFGLYGGIAGTPLTAEEKVLLISQSVHNVGDRLQVYRRMARRGEFCPHLLAVLGECTFRGITPAMLAEAALRVPSKGLSGKLSEMAMIFTEYNRLVEQGYNDPDHMLEKAWDLLEKEPFWQGKTVLIDGFKDFTHPQMQLLLQMAVNAKDLYLTLCADGVQLHRPLEVFENQKGLIARLTRKVTALGGTVAPHTLLTQNHRAQTPGLAWMEGVLSGEEFSLDDPINEITICACTDLYDQAQTVASQIARLVRKEGYRYKEIAIIARDLSSCKASLENALQNYGVPYFTDRSVPFSATPLGRFCLHAVELAQKGLTTEGILGLLKTGLSPLTAEEIALLENYTYTWGTQGQGWNAPFTRHPDGGEKQPAPSLTARLNTLRQQVVTPLNQLAEGCNRAKTAREFALALYEFLVQTDALKGTHRLAEGLQQTDPFTADDLYRSPPLLISLFDRMVRALAHTPLTLSEFAGHLELMMKAMKVGAIPQGVDQVLIGDALHTRPAGPKAVMVVGANNGVFPGVPASGGLLSDRDREMLIQLDIPVSDRMQEDTVEEEFLFYTAACQASHQVFFTYLTAENGIMCTPLSQLLHALPGCRHIASHRRSPLLQTAALAPAADLLANRFYENSPLIGSLYTFFEQNYPTLTAQMNRQTAPAQTALTPQTANAVFGKNITVSPTGIEVYHKCAFSYLLKNGLGLYPRKKVEMDPLSRGSMVHYVLEHMVTRHGGKAMHTLKPDTMKEEIHTLLMEFVEQTMGGTGDKTPHFLFQLTSVESLLFSMLQHMALEMKESLFTPAACERKIKEGGDVPPFAVPLNTGATLYVQGTVDRVDTYQKEGVTYFRVVDYKTGSKDFVLEDIHYGIGLQMLLYLFALEKNDTALGALPVPAGVLYMPAAMAEVKAGEEDPAKALASCFKMKGLVLENPDVIHAMDPLRRGYFVPISYTQNGNLSAHSVLASLEYLGKTRKRITQLLEEMGNTLLSGAITCDPLDPASTGAGACDYCDYKALCPTAGQGIHRKVKKLSSKEKTALLKGDDLYGDHLHPRSTKGN